MVTYPQGVFAQKVALKDALPSGCAETGRASFRHIGRVRACFVLPLFGVVPGKGRVRACFSYLMRMREKQGKQAETGVKMLCGGCNAKKHALTRPTLSVIHRQQGR